VFIQKKTTQKKKKKGTERGEWSKSPWVQRELEVPGERQRGPKESGVTTCSGSDEKWAAQEYTKPNLV